MNTLDLTNKRDFPLSTNALKFIQDAYADFEQLAKLGGDNYILSGCVVTGSSASNGWVVIGGKLMPFVASTLQTDVKVVTTTTVVTVGSGTREQTVLHAEFGTSANPAENIAWAVLNANRIANKRLITNDEATKLTELYTKAQLDVKFATTKIDLTPYSGFTLPDSTYYFNLRKNGNVITLNVKVLKANPGSPIRIGRVPEGYRPSESVQTIYRAVNDFYGGGVTSDGFIENAVSTINTALYATATWIID